MEHTARCMERGCGWSESWDNPVAAKAAGVHHVYAKHPSVWFRVVGARLPEDSAPETLGRKLEDWERQ